jgi:epoxyqueuosine reductase
MILSLDEIRTLAFQLGWDDIGATSATIRPEDIESYHDWISQGQHADLTYMENANRCDPQQLLPGAKTAIIFVSYYKQEPLPFKKEAGLIASYARGRDYHHVHRKRLKKMIHWIEERSGEKNVAKGFSDSSPILEKALAVQAGLGWFGKNTLLIHRRFGTFTLLSGLLTTLEIDRTEHSLRLPKCGSCTRCLDACPTQALVTPYRLDAARCLSYHLIESKREIPADIQARNPGYAFGCDICQDVCPHNSRKPISLALEWNEAQGVGSYLTDKKLRELKEEPERLFGTPLQRRKVEGLNYSFQTLGRDNED